MGSLARQTIAALSWSYLGVAVHILLQVGTNIAYARLLGPDQFGLYASGLLLTGILKIVSDLGLGSAITQASDLGDREIRAVFTRLLLSGSVAGLLLFAAAGLGAQLLKDVRLVPVFRCFALAQLLFPFMAVCQGLLARKLDQKRAQIANVAGYALGYGAIGLSAAAMGFKAWSPIIGFFSQLIINIAVLYGFTRPDLRPLWSRPSPGRELSHFGMQVMMTNVANWLIYSMDNFLVQRFFGTRQFGLYSVAYNICRTPTDHVVQSIQNVLVPASARVKNDRERLGRSYLALIDAVLIVTLPVFATLSVLATTFVATLYGPKWAGAELVLAPLALAMPFQALNMMTSALLWGTGQVRRELKVQVICASLLVFAILICVQWSFTAVAWGVFAVYGVRALFIVRALARPLGLSPARILTATRASVVISLMVAPSLFAVDRLLHTLELAPAVKLMLEVFLAALIYMSAVLLTARRIWSDELRALASSVFAHFEPKLRWVRSRRLSGI